MPTLDPGKLHRRADVKVLRFGANAGQPGKLVRGGDSCCCGGGDCEFCNAPLPPGISLNLSVTLCQGQRWLLSYGLSTAGSGSHEVVEWTGPNTAIGIAECIPKLQPESCCFGKTYSLAELGMAMTSYRLTYPSPGFDPLVDDPVDISAKMQIRVKVCRVAGGWRGELRLEESDAHRAAFPNDLCVWGPGPTDFFYARSLAQIGRWAPDFPHGNEDAVCPSLGIGFIPTYLLTFGATPEVFDPLDDDCTLDAAGSTLSPVLTDPPADCDYFAETSDQLLFVTGGNVEIGAPGVYCEGVPEAPPSTDGTGMFPLSF